MKNLRFLLTALVLVALLAAPSAPAFGDATFIINNLDPPGAGFNDPTPVAPVGGNPGVTLGEQRLNVFEYAAAAWGQVIDSDVDIVVGAVFVPLGCSPFAATLGSAGSLQVFAFPPGFLPNVVPEVWYHSALTNALAGFDATPGPPDPFLGFGNDEIFAFFNSAIDNNPDCLPGNWYYGLDHNNDPVDVDLLSVVMHEFAHGLGFANFTNETTGAPLGGRTDIFSVFTLDTTQNKTWAEMTDAERQASAINDGNVVWNGANVTDNAPRYLNARPQLVVNKPSAYRATYPAQDAEFGPALSDFGKLGKLVLADDGVGEAADACEPLTNNVNRRIVLVDRGSCSFVQKVLNAQAGGARAVVVANNLPDGLPPMGGADPTVTIPSIGVSQAAGDDLKAALASLDDLRVTATDDESADADEADKFFFGGSVVVTLNRNQDLRIGANDAGQVLIYAPPVVQSGSSLSHWDTSATPNLLMEPFISDDLTPAVDVDLTRHLFQDIGWLLADSDADGVPNADDMCSASDLTPTVVIDGCDSGAANVLLDDGCSVSDELQQCADEANNHGQYVLCVAAKTTTLWLFHIISGSDALAINACALQSSLP